MDKSTSTYKHQHTPWMPGFLVSMPQPVSLDKLARANDVLIRKNGGTGEFLDKDIRTILLTDFAIKKMMGKSIQLKPKDYGQFPDGL